MLATPERSEDRRERSEDRSEHSEDRSERSEDRSERREDRRSEEIRVLADEMMALVDGDDALRAPRGAYSYHLVVAAQAAWSAGDGARALARTYTARALAAAEEYGGPDDTHVAVLREVLSIM